METQHDSPISEIVAPMKIEQTQLANYPIPPPSPDCECLDVSSDHDSEDWQSKSTPAWCYNYTDSYGS